MNRKTEYNDLYCMSVTGMVSSIRNKQVSCTELVRSHLSRIDTVNPLVNAVTVKLEESALEIAEEADAKLAKKLPVGRLHGVPFTIEEIIGPAGFSPGTPVQSCGNAANPVNAPHIRQLIDAGAIPVARTNSSELCIRPHTDNPLFGATINPWNRNISPGGSGGGDAVAVATGMSPLGTGNGYNGSTRIPAQFCGVTSIKSTSGRVASYNATLPFAHSLAMQLFFSQGPVARTVRDLRLVLDSTSSYDIRDPHWRAAPPCTFPAEKPAKIGIAADPGMDDAARRTIETAAEFLLDAGYAVEDVKLPSVDIACSLFVRMLAMEVRNMIIPSVTGFLCAKTERYVKFLSDLSPCDSLGEYISAYPVRTSIAYQWDLLFRDYPVILAPGFLGPVPEVDFDIKSEESFRSFIRSSRIMFMPGFLGIPAASVPVGLENALPVSVQVISGRFREDLCLDIAQVIENCAGVFTPIDPQD